MFYWPLLIVVVFAIWVVLSIKFVGPGEMAVKVILGIATSVCNSGPCFVPWFFWLCYLKHYPLTMFDLNYDSIKVMSRGGDYNGKFYGAVEVDVESMAYLNFPRKREMVVDKLTGDPVCFLKDLSSIQREEIYNSKETVYNVPTVENTPVQDITVILERTHPLIKILRAGVPTTKKELEDWSEEGMTSSVRSAGAEITWKEANENPLAFKDKVDRSYLRVDGTLIQAGFRPSGIKLAIKRVNPPQQLKDALAGEASAAHIAKREAVEVGDSLIEMVNKQIEEMKKYHEMTKEDCMKVRQECLNQLTRDRTMKGGGNLVDTRIASADGSSFAQGSISEIVGGIVAAVAASSISRGGGKQSNRGGGPKGNRGGSREKDSSGGQQERKNKKIADMTDDELEKEVEDI